MYPMKSLSPVPLNELLMELKLLLGLIFKYFKTPRKPSK